MKKKLAWLLTALLLASALTACGKKESAQPDTTAKPEAQTQTNTEAKAGQSAGPYSVDGSVVFEKDGVKVTTAGLDFDPTSADAEPIVWLDVENTSGKDACLGVTDGSVNGVMSELRIVEFSLEDGQYCGGNYAMQLTVPAGSSRYALWYGRSAAPGVDLSTLGELEFRFTTAEHEDDWPNYTSEPVVIATGESVPAIDITGLGTVALDNDTMTLVLGEQDYGDWAGPEVWVYLANKSDKYIGVYPETAEADGVFCDYLFGGLRAAPGKLSVGTMSFDGEARELKGFENLTMNFTLVEAAAMDDFDHLFSGDGTKLDPVSVQYPPQVWGEYENGGMKLSIRPKYNDLITVTTPENDKDGILISVSETASLETEEFEGVGWLFDIGRVDEAKLHEMLCYDMSGADVFAKDESGNYYVWYHPTDVRYARATAEEMARDAEQWSMLCEWAESMKDKFSDQNGLEYVGFGNSEVDMYVARAAWESGVNYTLSTTEFGPVDGGGVDGTPYAEFLMKGYFMEIEDEEAPDGEYVVLNFPDEDVRVDFFFAPDAYARVVSGDRETVYQAVWWDDNISYTEAMQGWYYALAERAGVKQADKSLDPYCGLWGEKIAGRGQIECEKALAPGKVKLTVTWPESASVQDTWELFATLEDGKLVYESGHKEVVEYDENGENWTTDESYDESGYFYLSGAKELCWHSDQADGEDSVFIRAD